MKSLNSLPNEVRGVADKVAAGKLTRQDLIRLRDLPPETFERFEFIRVLAGGNPECLEALIEVAQYSLRRDLSGEALPGRG